MIRNFFIIIWPIEVLIALFNQEQRLGDKAAGTKLVRYDPGIHECKPDSLDTFAAIAVASVVTMAFYVVSYWRF